MYHETFGGYGSMRLGMMNMSKKLFLVFNCNLEVLKILTFSARDVNSWNPRKKEKRCK